MNDPCKQVTLKVYAALTYAEARIVINQDNDTAYKFMHPLPDARFAATPDQLRGYESPTPILICGRLGDWLREIDSMRAKGAKVMTRWT